jgi:ribosomal protein L16 Arg81 hydroxylase
MTDWAKQLTDHDWPKTDPTTLSAAELDAIEQIATDPTTSKHHVQQALLTVIAQARRTEAAERTLAKIEAECSRLEFAGGRGTVSCYSIRRALAEN